MKVSFSGIIFIKRVELYFMRYFICFHRFEFLFSGDVNRFRPWFCARLWEGKFCRSRLRKLRLYGYDKSDLLRPGGCCLFQTLYFYEENPLVKHWKAFQPREYLEWNNYFWDFWKFFLRIYSFRSRNRSKDRYRFSFMRIMSEYDRQKLHEKSIFSNWN